MGRSAGGANGRAVSGSDTQAILNQTASASKIISYNKETGYFASPGRNTGIRNFHSDAPHSNAEQFAECMRGNWIKQPIDDGWKATNGKITITYRSTTKTETNYPAVDIHWNRRVTPLTGLQSQRMHFLGGTTNDN